MDKYANWPAKTEAAALLQISVKTLERLADKGTIRQRMRPRPGGSPVAVFNPEDIDKELARRITSNGHPVILPAEENLPAVQNGNRMEFLTALSEMLDKLLNQPRPESPHLITMEEAQALGWTKAMLRRFIREGKLQKFGRWHVSRFELERLAGRVDTVQTPDNTLSTKALPNPDDR